MIATKSLISIFAIIVLMPFALIACGESSTTTPSKFPNCHAATGKSFDSYCVLTTPTPQTIADYLDHLDCGYAGAVVVRLNAGKIMVACG